MELVAFHRLAQRHFEHAALLRLDVQFGFVGVVDAAARILGAIEGKVGGADQHFRRPPVARTDRQAYRRADVERVRVDLIGLRQRVDDAAGQCLDRVDPRRVAHDDGEFVTTEPSTDG